jgi:hypothetical protein
VIPDKPLDDWCKVFFSSCWLPTQDQDFPDSGSEIELDQFERRHLIPSL